MEVIAALEGLGYQINVHGENIRLKPLPGIRPNRIAAEPLIKELKSRKQDAIDFLSAQDATRTPQTKFCSWQEMAVPAEECNPPCYIYKAKECKHLLAWWQKRLKWLEENRSHNKGEQEKSVPPRPDCFDPDGYVAPDIEGLSRKHYTYYVLVAFDLLNRGKTISQGIVLQHGPTKDWWSRFKEQYSDVLRWRDNGKDEYVGLEEGGL